MITNRLTNIFRVIYVIDKINEIAIKIRVITCFLMTLFLILT